MWSDSFQDRCSPIQMAPDVIILLLMAHVSSNCYLTELSLMIEYCCKVELMDLSEYYLILTIVYASILS
uniref:Uncharacterized protein n=1 Tax=Rhizophora mucronata TaxID=61149 RepID=A0A2P2J3H3_RHIMU